MKYVITGGPGSGKTSILLALDIMGENIVRECAEDYIKLQQARGIRHPWEAPNFQEELLSIQLRRESRLDDHERIFLDGSILDFLVYTSDRSIWTRVINFHKLNPYHKIFFIEPLNNYEQTFTRRESFEEAREIGKQIRKIYESFGYNLYTISIGNLDARVNQIWESLT